jgi:hypothetical protein
MTALCRLYRFIFIKGHRWVEVGLSARSTSGQTEDITEAPGGQPCPHTF